MCFSFIMTYVKGGMALIVPGALVEGGVRVWSDYIFGSVLQFLS